MIKKRALLILGVCALTFSGLVGCGNSEVKDDTDQPGDNPGDNPGDYPGGVETIDYSTGPKLPDGEKGIAIHYQRKNKDYGNWCLWIWENNGGEGQIYNFEEETDGFGAVCFEPLTTWSDNVITNGLGIITRKVSSWDGQSSDMMLDFANFETDDNGYYHIFITDQKDKLFDNPYLKQEDEISMAAFLSESRIRIEGTNPIDSYKIYKGDEVLAEGSEVGKVFVNYDFEGEIDVEANYRCEVKFKDSGKTLTAEISKRGLYDSDTFNDKFYYDGELGAIYNKEKTIFRVWSPLSSEITLRIYDNGTPTSVNASLGSDKFIEYKMTKGEKGVFETEVNGDLAGKYYTYVVTNSKYAKQEVVDPYAKSTGVNGLRGMIVDFSKTNPEGWDDINILPYKRTELTIYETHIADVTSSDTWGGDATNAKKFTGMYEEGTTFTEENKTVLTGFDHIKELGVNAVQLLPIFDQANDELATGDDAFNWGYNPLNYNSLDGIYSKNPYDGYEKIKEFKELVKSYHNAGINIIMDVVYNHVNAAEKSNFDVLMPEYYFRIDTNGKYSNGSGCGNETASENLMVRKFIVDSTLFWAEEYKLGGFRFDLMGLHDIDTMNEVASNLKENYSENIFVHGEPWTGGTTLLSGAQQSIQSNISKFNGYGAFNDKIRDSLIKGGLSGLADKGWATNNETVNSVDETDVRNGIQGKTGIISSDPSKATNYVTCHDNYTLYDRIRGAFTENDVVNIKDDEIANMATLANSIVFTSQGTSFMLAGEEMLRTKGGDGNSYASGYEVNALDYSRLIDFENVYNNYQSLIDLKKNLSALHYTTSKDIEVNLSFDTSRNGVIDYTIKSDEGTYRFLHINPSLDKVELGDLSNCEIILDTKNNESSLDNFVALSSESIVLKLKA